MSYLKGSPTVWVTGASRGLGATIAGAFENNGATVLRFSSSLIDFKLDGAVRSFADSYSGDIPDVLILNAGINDPTPIGGRLPEVVDQTMRVNFNSNVELISWQLPLMIARGYGRIVGISSLYASRARAGRAAYSASKAAFDALLRASAVEGAAHNVLVNSVSPGFLDNELTRKNNDSSAIKLLEESIPIGRLAQEEELLGLILLLASAENTYITGQNIWVDGGYGLK